MVFTEASMFLREICNGIICISALILVGIFSHYIFERCRDTEDCYNDLAVQAAVAIIILLLGHAIRAFSGWMQFLFLDRGLDANYWSNAAVPFLVATVLIVTGKMLIVFAFAPARWRWPLVIGTGTVSVLIPVVVAIAME